MHKYKSIGGMEVTGTISQWSLRTLEQHHAQSVEYLQCKTNADLNMEFAFQFYKTFQTIRNHVIDPMHNLLVGTSKHMLEVWIKLDNQIFLALLNKLHHLYPVHMILEECS